MNTHASTTCTTGMPVPGVQVTNTVIDFVKATSMLQTGMDKNTPVYVVLSRILVTSPFY